MDLIGGSAQPAAAAQRGATMPVGCEACPAPGAICGPEACKLLSAIKGGSDAKFGSVSNLADFALMKAKFTDRGLKISSESSVNRESSAQTGHVGGGAPIENKLTCDSCGNTYSSGTSCKHESSKKAA